MKTCKNTTLLWNNSEKERQEDSSTSARIYKVPQQSSLLGVLILACFCGFCRIPTSNYFLRKVVSLSSLFLLGVHAQMVYHPPVTSQRTIMVNRVILALYMLTHWEVLYHTFQQITIVRNFTAQLASVMMMYKAGIYTLIGKDGGKQRQEPTLPYYMNYKLLCECFQVLTVAMA